MSSFAVSSDFLRDPGALAILRAHRTAELESLTLGGRFSPAVLAAVVELGGRNLAQLHIDVEVVEVDHNWDAAVLALARSTRFPALRRAQVPPISLSAGVALTRAPRAMATAVLLGSSGPWLRALAAELEVKLPPRASIPMAVARLVAH